MAEASPNTASGAKARPLSPHLQIWRWGPAMAISILHRITGNGLAVVGIPILLCWLGALASGPAAYATFAGYAVSPLGRLILVGLSWAFFNHFASGLRHFVLDIGAGFELKANAFWSVLTPIVAIVFTAAFWAALLLR